MKGCFDPKQVELLASLLMVNPHAFLGIHSIDEVPLTIPKMRAVAAPKRSYIRLWRPGATQLYLEVFGKLQEAKLVDKAGLFIYESDQELTPFDYRVYQASGELVHDPYAFLPTLGELDQHLFSQGLHYHVDKVMGGREREHQGIQGASFTLWAPNARSVSLVCDSNLWDGRLWPMRSLGRSGIWELFVPGLKAGERYKFEIQTQEGKRLIKADPMALASELRPSTASVLASGEPFPWTDQLWSARREKGCSANGYREAKHSYPISIYELHLGSWKRKFDYSLLNYRELAHQLVRYCHDMGFTHVELLPVMEHPLDASWGYQVTGYFSVTARWGSLKDFQYFVNYLHNHDIGVILDWVPAHFPCDDHALAYFDGTPLYEHADPTQGYHPHWKTQIFNLGRVEVSNFLIGSALYWCRELHIDGLRVDAVASMIYLDYGREEGQWVPNRFGGKESLESLEFLRHLNSILHHECPGVLTFAEESTSFLGVTHALDRGGLGFDFKWNMGWMNDTLRYMARDPIYRRYHYHELTFSLVYAFSEHFTLVLSHDEVVHGKGSLVNKMPGDEWQKLAQLRLLYSLMIAMPGKKLLFMGGEIAQTSEWNHESCLPWYLLQYASHHGMQSCVRSINKLYLAHSPLWYDDLTHEGFSWVQLQEVGSNQESQSALAYYRISNDSRLLCIHHFMPEYHPHYCLTLRGVKAIKELFNSDDPLFWGSGKGNRELIQARGEGQFMIELAPFATQIFEVIGN